MLIVGLVAVLCSTPVMRLLVIGPLLAGAVDPFRYANEPLPWLTRLAISGYATWGGVVLCIAALAVGLVLRAKGSALAGRSVLALGLIAPLTAGSLDLIGITAAWYGDPTEFGSEGIGRCTCPELLRCVGATCMCGCNMNDEVAVQLLDGDGDGRFETRCVFEPPCGRGSCARPVCNSVVSD